MNKKLLATSILAFCAVLPALAQTEPPKPVVNHEARAERETTIHVCSDDTYKIGRSPIKASELTIALKLLAGFPEPPPIIVRPDRDASYAQIVRVLDAAHDANLREITFAGFPPKQSDK